MACGFELLQRDLAFVREDKHVPVLISHLEMSDYDERGVVDLACSV